MELQRLARYEKITPLKENLPSTKGLNCIRCFAGSSLIPYKNPLLFHTKLGRIQPLALSKETILLHPFPFQLPLV